MSRKMIFMLLGAVGVLTILGILISTPRKNWGDLLSIPAGEPNTETGETKE